MNKFIVKILILTLIFTNLTFCIPTEKRSEVLKGTPLLNGTNSAPLASRAVYCPIGYGLCPDGGCAPTTAECCTGYYTYCPYGEYCVYGGNCCYDGYVCG